MIIQEYGGWAEDYLSSIPVVEPKDNLMLNQGIGDTSLIVFLCSHQIINLIVLKETISDPFLQIL